VLVVVTSHTVTVLVPEPVSSLVTLGLKEGSSGAKNVVVKTLGILGVYWLLDCSLALACPPPLLSFFSPPPSFFFFFPLK